MDQHLTIAEARSLTGKSDSTLKRLVREITQQPDHPDRLSILPTHDEVERRRAAKEPYIWKIDRALLLRRFPDDEQSTDTGQAAKPKASTDTEHDIVLRVLREQLKSKDDQLQTLEVQLDRKDEQIANLNERMRESNVLMKELQQRLAITAPASRSDDGAVVDVSESPSSHREKSDPKPQSPRSKKTFFGSWPFNRSSE